SYLTTLFATHTHTLSLHDALPISHKTAEIRTILGDQFQVNHLAEHPEIPHIAETGRTFEDNAILKAVTVSKHIPGFVVADDSGRSEEHTSELQSPDHLVCRLLLEK